MSKKKKRKKYYQPNDFDDLPKKKPMEFIPRFAQMRMRNTPDEPGVEHPIEDISARQYDPGVLTFLAYRKDENASDRVWIDWDNCQDADIRAFLQGE